MKITKWVDMGQDVEIEISSEDVRSILSEAFANVTQDRLGEEPSRSDVLHALNSIGEFLNALSDDQIALMTERQRHIVGGFLGKQAARFTVVSGVADVQAS